MAEHAMPFELSRSFETKDLKTGVPFKNGEFTRTKWFMGCENVSVLL